MSNYIQEQNQQREDYRNLNRLQRDENSIRKWLCHRITKGVLFILVFATVCPVLVYYFVIDRGDFVTSDLHTCLVDTSYRVSCGATNVTRKQCEAVHCCYDESSHQCYHYLPSKYYYHLSDTTNYYLPSYTKTPFGNASIEHLKVTVHEIDETTVSLILHKQNINIIHRNGLGNKTPTYNVTLDRNPFNFEVTRYGDTKNLLLTTVKGPIIASENYWEITLMLTNEYLFGMGKNLIRLDNTTLTRVVYKNPNDHDTMPVLWAYQKQQFHGIIIKNDGPMELEVLPSNLLIVRSLTGEKIEIELSTGPTPRDLSKQYTENFVLLPYWVLGTHFCRKSDSTSLYDILQDYSQSKEAIEYDTDCIHENLVTAISKNISNENMGTFREILSDLVTSGKKILLSLPPQIYANETNPLYASAQKLDVLYKNSSTDYIGKYLDVDVAYPDFYHSNAQSYIQDLNQFIEDYVGIENVSGFVLNDNWPVDASYRMNPNNTGFSYMSDALQRAMSLTLPWYLNTSDGTTKHFKHHNSYGSYQKASISLFYKNTKPDLSIISASKLYGESQPISIQNVNASWDNMREILGKVLFNSISGNHLVSIPVCGDTEYFQESLQESLCIRWYLISVTMPMFRVNAKKPFRNPENLNSIFATNVTARAIAKRKTLQPFYYTILTKKEPIVRPMYYDYFEGNETLTIENQYMIGESILVAHPFASGRTKLQVFLSKKIGIWYELWGGILYNSTKTNSTVLDIVETDWISFISQGSIVPLIDGTELNLIVALNCTTTPCKGTGELYHDGTYIAFSSNRTTLTVENIPIGGCGYILGYVRLYFYENHTGGTAFYQKKNLELCNAGTIQVDYDSPSTTTQSPITTAQTT